MARPVRPWFRFYVEAINDPKLRRLPPAWRWLWPTAMSLARQSPIPGKLLITAADELVEPLTFEDLVDAAAMPSKDVKLALAEFYRLGMMHDDAELGCMVVTKFGVRQFESDEVTKRTRKHRSKEPPRNVPGNGDGTSKERSNDVPGNVPGTVMGTPPETETDTDLNHHPQTDPRDDLSTGDDDDVDKSPRSNRDDRLRRARAACQLLGLEAYEAAADVRLIRNASAYRATCLASAEADYLGQAQLLAHQHRAASPDELADMLRQTAPTSSPVAEEGQALGLYEAAEARRLERLGDGPAEQDQTLNRNGAAAARAALRTHSTPTPEDPDA